MGMKGRAVMGAVMVCTAPAVKRLKGVTNNF